MGSDIDTGCSRWRAEGIYGKRALMRLSPELVARYFAPNRQRDAGSILDDLRESVRFTPVNLVEPGRHRLHGRFDVIFCRNVLIYFDDASRRLAAENLYENLAPGGVHLPRPHRIDEPDLAAVRGLPLHRLLSARQQGQGREPFARRLRHDLEPGFERIVALDQLEVRLPAFEQGREQAAKMAHRPAG